MNNLDLNISNYTFDDILGLFKLDTTFTEPQLIKCKDKINKLHPNNSNLSIEYYNLYIDAYNLLNEYLIHQLHLQEESTNKINDVKNNDTNQQLYNSYNTKLALENSCYTPPCLFSTRMVTVHTEDRDIMKYPCANNFEVELPSTIKNTLSIELFDITLPTFYYNISEYLQNTSLWFSIPALFADPIEIRMMSGFYNSNNIISELESQLNLATASKIADVSYSDFTVSYNSIENKFMIANSLNTFTLYANMQSVYDTCTFDCWKMLNYWGFSYNIGLNREIYTSIYDTISGLYIVQSVLISKLDIYNTIYMEIDTYNWIDEITPFSVATNHLYNNDYGGTVNSSFAKLILSNVSNCYVPTEKIKRVLPHMVEKIAKLKFKFRYHTGIPVDFMNQDFNMALKFECRFNCTY